MDKDIVPFEMKRWLYGLPPDLYYVEIGVRVLAVFFVLLLILRLLGKRGQKNLSPMQNILMISLGTAVGDVMIMPNVPFFYSLLVLVLIPLLIMVLQFAKLKSLRIRNFVNADPQIIVRKGKLQKDIMDKNRMTKEEVYSQLRIAKIKYLEEVDCMVFEPSGEMSVFKVENFTDSMKQTNLLDKLEC